MSRVPTGQEIDGWFYDLDALAAQVERNRVRSLQANRRVEVIAAFMVACFLLLAWRTETNAQHIDDTQYASCAAGVHIIEQFNSQQRALAAIEEDRALPGIGVKRIKAYQSGMIDPPPHCTRR